MLAYVTRYKTRASVVYCELDESKEPNDRCGHAARAATEKAKHLMRKFRSSTLYIKIRKSGLQ